MNKADPLKQRSYKSCCWYAGLVLIGLPILLVALAVSFVAFADRQANAEVEKKIANWKAQGVPTDAKSLNASYLNETDPRNTEKWMEIFESLKTKEYRDATEGIPVVGNSDQDAFPSPGAPWKYREKVASFLSKQKRIKQRIQRLSLEQLKPDAKYVRLPVEMNGIATLLEPWQDIRGAARLLQLSGHQAIDRRDSAGLRRDIAALIGCSEVASPNVCLVTELISVALSGMALELLREGLRENVLDPEDLEPLLPYIEERCKLGRNWRSCIQAERAIFGLNVFDSPNEFGAEIRRLPFRGKDKLNYLNTMESYIDAPLDSIDSLLEATNAVEESFDYDNPVELFNHAMSYQLVPAGGALASAEARTAAQHRMLYLAMQLKLFEAKNGKFPESLSEIEGVDLQLMRPGGGKPFGYFAEKGEAMIWFDHEHGPTPDLPPAIDDGQPNNSQIMNSQIRLKSATDSE